MEKDGNLVCGVVAGGVGRWRLADGVAGGRCVELDDVEGLLSSGQIPA